MKKFMSITISLLLALSLAACSSPSSNNTTPPASSAPASEAPATPAPVATPTPSATPAPAASEAPKEEAPVSTQILLNGSSTLAPVITSIATTFNETYVNWNAYDASLPEAPIAIYVSAGGSGQGAKAMIEKTSDFGLLARLTKSSEIEQIPDYREYLVGVDALTIAINPENPASALTDNLDQEEIVKIFSGEYKTWKDFDPSLPEEEIIVVIRDIGGGAHEVFQNNIMIDVDVKADAIQAPSMGALVTKLIESKYAIGYASFGIVMQNEGKIFTYKVNDVAPTVETIVDGSYIIQRPLLIIGSGEPTAPQQAFLDVVLGEEGQSVVEKMGFVPAN